MGKNEEKKPVVVSAVGPAASVEELTPVAGAAELEAALKQNQRLSDQLSTAEARVTELEGLVKALSGTNKAQADVLKTNDDEIAKLKADRVSLSAQNDKLAARAAKGLPEGDLVVHQGKTYRIDSVYTAKWVGTEVLKRFIPEDATVVVLGKPVA